MFMWASVLETDNLIRCSRKDTVGTERRVDRLVIVAFSLSLSVSQPLTLTCHLVLQFLTLSVLCLFLSDINYTVWVFLTLLIRVNISSAVGQ